MKYTIKCTNIFPKTTKQIYLFTQKNLTDLNSLKLDANKLDVGKVKAVFGILIIWYEHFCKFDCKGKLSSTFY